MNSYIFLRRIKGPVMIVVFGITALLNQWHVLSYGESWPLYLIAWGMLQLGERAAWSQAQELNQYPAPPTGNSGNWAGGPTAQPPSSTSTALSVQPWDEGRK
ncbi:MAG TPA: hypothetical protein VGT04_13000 [Acidobacteriaceae bacterium]|nr:hypothetical protein [Acidobacteriaceae bacterium]